MRSRYMQGFMAHIPAHQRREVVAIIGPETTSTIGDAGPFVWLPIEVNVAATRAVAETLGPRATDTFFRTLALQTFELPILKGLVSAVVRLAGRDPMVGYRWLDRGYSMVFRNAGRWTVSSDAPGSATLRCAEMADSQIRDRTYCASVGSSMAAIIDLMGHDGTVTVADVNLDTRTLVLRARWAQK